MRMLAEDELREAVLLIFANKQVYLDDTKSLIPQGLFYYVISRIQKKFRKNHSHMWLEISINDNYHILNYFRICLTQWTLQKSLTNLDYIP